MKLYVNFALLVSVISSVHAIDFSQDAYIFLPLLRHYEPPPSCSTNEIYKTCTGMCSDCEQRGRCPVTTCVKGCDCAPRFYRVTPEGPCEPVANCPKPECGENEVFRECGPVCERCTSIRCQSISCDHKCYCKEGYLRNENGECILKDECPKREHCFRHEEWAESGLEDEYCPIGPNKTSSDKIQNVTQCYCAKGYKRDLFGHCVDEKRCASIHCFGAEVYHECIPKCNATCRSYGDPNCTEDGNCYSGCFCSSGFVKNDLGACIPQKNCSLDISQVKVIYEETEEESSTTPNPLQNSTEVEDAAEPSAAEESTGEYATDSDGTTAEISTSQSFMVTESMPEAEADADSEVAQKSTKSSNTEAEADSEVAQKSTKSSDTEAEADSEVAQKRSKSSDIEAKADSEVAQKKTKSSDTEAKADSEVAQKRTKSSNTEAKHENIAREKSIRKEEMSTDDDEFNNEEI